MKKQKETVCNHAWESLYVFKSIDGKRMVQQQCKKCHESRYIDYIENDQNDSKKE